MDYREYLHLPELLSLQRPLTGREARERVHAAERFFIVVHQASELWLAQALLDLELAASALEPPGADPDLALEHLERAAAVARLLAEHMAVLTRLPPSCFAAFRRVLGTASAAQSDQFAALQTALGLRERPSPVYGALLAALAERGVTAGDVYRDRPRARPFYRVAEALIDVAQHVLSWQVLHASVVGRMIGDRAGTGGTSGLSHLLQRVRLPYPELWEARCDLHDRTPVASAGGAWPR